MKPAGRSPWGQPFRAAAELLRSERGGFSLGPKGWPYNVLSRAARIAGALRLPRTVPMAPVAPRGEPGISVVIPSRNGRSLLEALLPGVARDLTAFASEIVIVDNGSSDGTAEWLRASWPHTLAVVSSEPLSFARAVNRGIALARFSRVCLLNNDMLIEPGFFAALMQPFERVPELFCATAQIRFPEGVRREETGKAGMADYGPEEFPIRCEEPLAGEDGTPVLYGSGGCSLYNAAKLRALGGVNEEYAPAYVEDLELGYRAWQRGWPTVYVAGAVVEHRHRATTSRYYTEQELDRILEINYLKFLAGNVVDTRLFGRLWRRAIERLRLRAAKGNAAAREALGAAAGIALSDVRVPDVTPGAEEEFLALTDGSVAVFPGRTCSGKPISIVTSALLNPCDEAPRAISDRVLVAGTIDWTPPPAELLEQCVEIALVRGGRESAAFRAAVRWVELKWGVGQLSDDGA